MKKPRYNKTRYILIFTLIAVLLSAFIAGTFVTRAVSGAVIAFTAPLFKLSSGVGDFIDGVAIAVASKKELALENEQLRREVASGHAKLLSVEALRSQNDELRKLVGRTPRGHTTVAASVIGAPPQSPYDTILIDVGSEDGIRRGMRIVTSDGVFLGVAKDVFNTVSKVQLISSPGVSTEVRITELGVMTEAIGRGGGNFIITLPEALSPKVGDTVVTPELDFSLIGVIGAIKVDVASPVQKLFFRFPVSLRELRSVLVVL